MALPTIAVASAAIDSLYAIFNDRPERQGNRQAVAVLNELKGAVVAAYKTDVSVLVTDALDADVADFISTVGEGGIANGGSGDPKALVVGDIFTVLGTGDFIDNYLAGTAGTPAAAERFQVASGTTLTYLGTATEVSFADEETDDFMSIGS